MHAMATNQYRLFIGDSNHQRTMAVVGRTTRANPGSGDHHEFDVDMVVGQCQQQ